MEKKIKQQVRRKYDAGFKTEAIKMVESGRSVSEVSQSLGVGENVLYNWVKAHKGTKESSSPQITGEIVLLRMQLKQAEQDRDILKKALIIFSQKT
jgi:transposase